MVWTEKEKGGFGTAGIEIMDKHHDQSPWWRCFVLFCAQSPFIASECYMNCVSYPPSFFPLRVFDVLFFCESASSDCNPCGVDGVNL